MVNYSPKLVSSDVHGVKLWPVFCILTSVTNTSRIWVTSHPIPYINSTVTGYMSKFYEAIKWIKQMSQPFLQWPKTEKCYISSISCSEPFFQKIWSYRSNSYVTKHPPGDFYSIIMFLTQENAKKWKNAKTQMSNFSPTLMTASIYDIAKLGPISQMISKCMGNTGINNRTLLRFIFNLSHFLQQIMEGANRPTPLAFGRGG